MDNIKIKIQDLSLYYGDFQALYNVKFDIPGQKITAIIGPSGCGKSTLLRCLNRMNDLTRGVRVEGNIAVAGKNIYGPGVDLVELRRNVGMVFQRPNPFPISIFDNVAYGLSIHKMVPNKDIDGRVEQGLSAVGLWDSLKDRLQVSALTLSQEQQQRLCIARLVAMEPQVLLMDEPCSALDPIATDRIEYLMRELSDRYTIVIVTHNMQQAARISDYTAFFYLGSLIEYDETKTIFTAPAKKETEDYITGRFG